LKIGQKKAEVFRVPTFTTTKLRMINDRYFKTGPFENRAHGRIPVRLKQTWIGDDLTEMAANRSMCT